RITTDYSFQEDRIQLVGHDEAGQVYQLWLTRRLSDRLLALLIEGLDPQDKATYSLDMMQSFEQEKAVHQIEATAPVTLSNEQAPLCWLVNNVDITRSPEGVVLVFKDDGDLEATLPLQVIELRQWLSICYKIYKTAEWPMRLWPAWITPDYGVSAQSDSVPLH
ncbi:MAG: hypothetical protein OIF58_16420, partial [Cohaesibacter sp.]|nr:hypothetical protein [Cohaesibacter sp.]